MKYILVFLLSVAISSISQVMLKSSAQDKHEDLKNEYLNFKVIFAYGLFFLSTLITVIAYKYVPLSLGPALEATGYIFVAVLGYIFLKEKISKRKCIGLIMIITGILVFNINL